MEVWIWDVMVVMGGGVDMGCDGGDGWRATDNCKSQLHSHIKVSHSQTAWLSIQSPNLKTMAT